jgi:ABC-type lipoprotein release transport system permease subunit
LNTKFFVDDIFHSLAGSWSMRNNTLNKFFSLKKIYRFFVLYTILSVFICSLAIVFFMLLVNKTGTFNVKVRKTILPVLKIRRLCSS